LQRYRGGAPDAEGQTSITGQDTRMKYEESCGNAESVESMDNQRQVFHFPTAFCFLSKRRTRDGRAAHPARLDMERLLTCPKTKGGISRQPASGIRRHFQAHRPLETKTYFRLILYWKQTQVSGSSYDWKMLPASPAWCQGVPRSLEPRSSPVTLRRIPGGLERRHGVPGIHRLRTVCTRTQTTLA